jgi:6-phosphogluconolactonase (cycloisomerase 2 family)
MNRPPLRLFLVLSALVAAFLTGCGGNNGNGAQQKGTLALSVTWPERTRLVPTASSSIRLVVTSAGVQVATQVIQRPSAPPLTQVYTFPNIPTGSATLSATAYPNADATGVAQAMGSTPFTITSAQTTNLNIAMDSTVNSLELGPATLTVAPGATLQITATGKNALGQVVLIAPEKITWNSATTGAATIDINGLVTGVAAGTSTITVTDTESGKSVQQTLTVVAAGPDPVRLQPWTMTVDSTGNYAYVADFGNTGTGGSYHGDLRQFHVNADGTLTPLTPASVAGVDAPAAIVAHPTLPYVYAGNVTNNTLSQFHVSADGTLTPLSPATIALPTGAGPASLQFPVAFSMDPAGQYLFVTGYYNYVGVLKVNADGTLTNVSSTVSNSNPTGIAATPVNSAGKQFLYVTSHVDHVLQTTAISIFEVKAGGVLQAVLTGNVQSNANYFSLAIDPTGQFLYAANDIGGAYNVSVYSIALTGALTHIGTDVPAGNGGTALSLNSLKGAVYVANQSGNSVSQMHINADGTLTSLSPATAPTSLAPNNITVGKNGQYVYILHREDGTLQPIHVNADGTLVP